MTLFECFEASFLDKRRKLVIGSGIAVVICE